MGPVLLAAERSHGKGGSNLHPSSLLRRMQPPLGLEEGSVLNLTSHPLTKGYSPTLAFLPASLNSQLKTKIPIDCILFIMITGTQIPQRARKINGLK